MSILLSYLSDKKGYRLWDLQKRMVVKSRDVVFDDLLFPYGTPLITPVSSVLCELPWPVMLKPVQQPAERTPTPDLPLLDIQLEPWFD